MDVTGESLGGRGNGGEVCPILCGHVERLSMLLVCGVCVVYFLRDYDREKHTPSHHTGFLRFSLKKEINLLFFLSSCRGSSTFLNLRFIFSTVCSPLPNRYSQRMDYGVRFYIETTTKTSLLILFLRPENRSSAGRLEARGWKGGERRDAGVGIGIEMS